MNLFFSIYFLIVVLPKNKKSFIRKNTFSVEKYEKSKKLSSYKLMWSVIKLFNTIVTIFWKYKNAFNLDFADIGGHALECFILRPFYSSSMVRSVSGKPGPIPEPTKSTVKIWLPNRLWNSPEIPDWKYLTKNHWTLLN